MKKATPRPTVTKRFYVCSRCGMRFSSVPLRTKLKYCSAICRKVAKKPSVHSMDLLWARKIRERAGGKCEYCGKADGLNSHHIFSRSNRTTRWDPDNGVSLCVAHHVFGNFSAHKSPIEFLEWLKGVRGEEWYARLRKNAYAVGKVDARAFKERLERI